MNHRVPEVIAQLMIKVKKEKSQYKFFKRDANARKVYFKYIISIHKQKVSKYLQYNTVGGRYEREEVYRSAF